MRAWGFCIGDVAAAITSFDAAPLGLSVSFAASSEVFALGLLPEVGPPEFSPVLEVLELESPSSLESAALVRGGRETPRSDQSKSLITLIHREKAGFAIVPMLEH
jgi:hypothetical protein